jgi:hypothetical protein
MDNVQNCDSSMKHRFGRLCGLLVRVSDYRSGDPGSIPGATRVSEKTIEELLERILAAPV